MLFIEEISWMSKSGYSNRELLEYIDKRYDEIECELNGEEYKEPKKHDHYFCMDWTMKGRLWFAPNVVYVSTIPFM